MQKRVFVVSISIASLCYFYLIKHKFKYFGAFSLIKSLKHVYLKFIRYLNYNTDREDALETINKYIASESAYVGFTAHDLWKYRGYSIVETHTGDPNLDKSPVYVSVKDIVYKVDPKVYGPEGNYHIFAGTEASCNLGKGLLDGSEKNTDWRSLSKEHMDSLNHYESIFKKKYKIVGYYIPNDAYKSGEFEVTNHE